MIKLEEKVILFMIRYAIYKILNASLFLKESLCRVFMISFFLIKNQMQGVFRNNFYFLKWVIWKTKRKKNKLNKTQGVKAPIL